MTNKNNQIWIDELTNNLRAAYSFFRPKHWTEMHNKIWEEALQWESAERITHAFTEYYKTGKHMPKPAEILSLIKDLYPKQQPARIDYKPPEEERRACDPLIQSAWVRFNKLQCNYNFPFETKVQLTDDQAITICNLEAKRLEYPDAIQKMFWLKEIWGHDKPYQTDEQKMESVKKKARTNTEPPPDYSHVLNEVN